MSQYQPIISISRHRAGIGPRMTSHQLDGGFLDGQRSLQAHLWEQILVIIEWGWATPARKWSITCNFPIRQYASFLDPQLLRRSTPSRRTVSRSLLLSEGSETQMSTSFYPLSMFTYIVTSKYSKPCIFAVYMSPCGRLYLVGMIICIVAIPTSRKSGIAIGGPLCVRYILLHDEKAHSPREARQKWQICW